MLNAILSWITFIFFTIDFILATSILWLLSFLPQSLLQKIRYRSLFRAWCRVFLRFLGVKIRVHQHYRSALPPQYMVISNHPSIVEDIGMLSVFDAVYLAKKEVKSWWVFGRISHAGGTLFFDRESTEGRKDAQALIQSALHNGDNVGLYPEGGAKGRRLHFPFHRGGLNIARECNVPVVPVFLYYEAQADFEWAKQSFIQKIIDVLFSRNKHVQLHIFDPIDTKAYDSIEACVDDIEKRYSFWQEKFLL